MGKALTLTTSMVLTLGAALASSAAGPLAGAETVVRTGGVGPHPLTLSVSTDTLPGTSAARYRVPSAAPVTIRYSVHNSSEAEMLDVRITDPQVPAARISCPGGGSRLAALSTMQCTATIPAADGAHLRTVRATGTVYWFGTPASATASTGYVGYNAGLSVQELVAGTGTGPATPAKPVVGSPVQLSYQITNTGDVPLTSLTLRSTLASASAGPEQSSGAQSAAAQGNCPTAASSQVLPPGGHLICTALANAGAGLHVDAAVASAVPQLTVVRGDGALIAPAQVSASALGAYLGVAPPPSSSSASSSASSSSNRTSAEHPDGSAANGEHAPGPLADSGPLGSPNLLQGLHLQGGGDDLGLSGNGVSQAGQGSATHGSAAAGSAAAAAGANGQAASGSQHRAVLRSSLPVSLRKSARAELPVLLMVFLILLVPLIAFRLRRHR